MILLKDYETRSRIDLAEVGQHRYATDPSTEILCIGWKVVGEKTNHLISYAGIYTDDPSETKEYYYALKHAEKVIAHNAPFEQAIYNYVESQTTPMASKVRKLMAPHDPSKYECTMAMANVMGLPAGLEKLALAIGLSHKKDVEGRKLMLKMCKPRTNLNYKTDIEAWLEWVLGDENLKRLGEYCETDLDVEEAAYLFFQEYKPFTAFERNLWVLDQVINQRGFKIDLPFVEAARTMLLDNEKVLNKELLEKTLHTVKTVKSTKALKNFISSQGYDLPNVQKKTVDDLLKDLRKQNLQKDKDLIDVLQIREELGLSSTSKYEAFYQRADRKDLRVRDNLLYHKASTGRWAGAGVQPQNFPRGSVKGIKKTHFQDFKDFAKMDAPVDIARMFYPRFTATLSSMLRGCIVAEKGKKFYVGDFASIEARVLLWLAQDVEGLQEYEQGLDTYITMAAEIFKRSYDEIFEGYKMEVPEYVEMRQLGKKVILACGYGMGLQKFLDTCAAEGLIVPESTAMRAHKAFKAKYPKVPELWRQVEKAAIYAVLNPRNKYKAGRCLWFIDKKFLRCQLPSGRSLWYYKPEVKYELTPWEEKKPVLYHWGVDSKTKQWVIQKTWGGTLVENIDQAASRDCMANSMTLLTLKGYDIVLTVHDELITESAVGTLDEFKNLMSTRPSWGLDIPLKVGAWCDDRYRK